MLMHLRFYFLFLLGFTCFPGWSQTPTQTVRGSVIDKISKSALTGATIVIVGSDPVMGTTTDLDGNFKLTYVPIGYHTLRISFVGYRERVLPNLVVNAGKEMVIIAALEEDITVMDAVVVTPAAEKDKPLNEMALVSARTFSVEETRKFAAAVNDPARMVSSYAGVVSTSDGNNAISIRGNSPYGLQWRMEGVEIPNPNHFANVAASGGGISILSSQLLTDSDFLTGAFPAEYGNALSGVFDLNLRKGNNEKREYTVQAGLLGLDVAAEGPFSQKYKGSYLVNYRYSTLSVLRALGLDVIQSATDFQDLSLNIHLPTQKAGNFSVFGFGGLSSQQDDAVADSLQWKENSFDRYDSYYFSNTGALGLKHALTVNTKTYLQSAVVVSGYEGGYVQDKLDYEYRPFQDVNTRYRNQKITVSSVMNHKINARHSMRSGFYLNRYFFNLQHRAYNYETQTMEQTLDARGDVTTLQLFSQWNHRLSERLALITGVHTLYLAENSTGSIEPRASLQYRINEQQSINLGYGWHSQMQPVGVYQAQVLQPDGTFRRPNENLGFNKSIHYVLGYDRSLSSHLRIKAETYYQQLYQLAVKNDVSSPLAINNQEDGYITDPLVNRGTGRNYGIELTVEQFTYRNAYFLVSTSLYDSKYRALDGILRNTRFNGNFASSITAGKEYVLPRNRVFGVNLRMMYSGGFRTTPLDVERSLATGKTEYIESQAFTGQLPNYFRTDLRVSWKKNGERFTSTLALDIQNVSNRQNPGGQYVDVETGSIKTWYQLPILPILSYKIEF